MGTWVSGDGDAGVGASVDAVTGLPGGCVGTPAMALWTVDGGVR